MDKGYTQINNGFLEVLYNSNLCYETRVLLFLIRKIQGFHKSSDKISYNEIVTATGIDRRQVIRAVNRLEKRKIIKVKRKNKCINIIAFVPSDKNDTRPSDNFVPNLVSKMSPTKESTKATPSSGMPLEASTLEGKENNKYWLEEDFDD